MFGFSAQPAPCSPSRRRPGLRLRPRVGPARGGTAACTPRCRWAGYRGSAASVPHRFFPPPSPGEGALTATKTSAPPRGQAACEKPLLGLGFFPPPKIHGHLQIIISWFPWNFQKFRQNFSKISKKSSKISEKIVKNHLKMKMNENFAKFKF